MWQIVGLDNERIEVNEEYIPGENSESLVGVGGTYKYTVKGLKQGNATLELAYIRAGVSLEEALRAMTVDLYVSKDNKITIFNIDNNVDKIKIDPGM